MRPKQPICAHRLLWPFHTPSNLVDVLQERGQGHTLLWEPEKAIEMYKESERLKPFRPRRDLGVLTILKAQAHAYAGAVDEGVTFALKGLELARSYESKRHISRVQRMYDRLSVTPLRKHPGLRDLEAALRQKSPNNFHQGSL